MALLLLRLLLRRCLLRLLLLQWLLRSGRELVLRLRLLWRLLAVVASGHRLEGVLRRWALGRLDALQHYTMTFKRRP